MNETAPVAADELAEQALLGAAIYWPDRCAETLSHVDPDDFFKPANGDLAAVIGGMVKSGQAIDTVTVVGQALANGLGRYWDAVRVFELTQRAMRPETAAEHANRIRELAGRRRLLIGTQRATQRLSGLTEDEGRDNVRAITGELRQFCDDAESTATDRDQPLPTRMGEFLRETEERHWLVPGLLERMDRTIVTGAEGGGKSVLCSQIAACLAGGVHPFSGEVMGEGGHQVRVLVIDCENSPSQSRRRYRWVIDRVNTVRQLGGFDPVDWSEVMSIDMRPKGIDLSSTRDLSWIEHAVSNTAPDLLVLGPLYKLHRGELDETNARELTWILDGLRERYGFALLTEAHAGNAKDPITGIRDMRPIGSSLWRRWPEFGFGMTRASDDPGKGRASIVDVVSWRGAREERAWPERLSMAHTLPWIPDAEYFDTLGDYETN